MKKTVVLIAFIMYSFLCKAQEGDSTYFTVYDSIENTFHYQHGEIALPNGIGKVVVPAGYKYLDGAQAIHVLVDLWGNPKEDQNSLGFLLPEEQDVMDNDGFVFNIEYEEIGYVKDDDAEDIDYADLLKEMQKEATDVNAERVKNGFEAITIVGWASPPYYDKDKKILHWAKEIKFGNAEVNTLNYNIRVLGRKGVLVINAISAMPVLAKVKKDIPAVMTAVQFNEGFQYKNYDSSVDEVAAWTIGGLVAGKVLAKVGFFALLLKFWKIIAVAVVAFFGTIWKKIRGKKEDTSAPEQENNNSTAESTENNQESTGPEEEK